jgi:hypothetical protein
MKRFLSFVLAVIMAVGCICVPAMAAEATEAFTWRIDPTAMSSITDNGGSADYTLTASGVTLTSVSKGGYDGKAIYIKDGQYTLTDTGHLLSQYPAFELSGDFYFDSFPGGTFTEKGITYSVDPTDANFYSQSFIAWVRATSASGSGSSYEGIRMDSEGNLYSGSNVSTALDVKLEEDTWYNIKLVFSVTEKVCDVKVNGKTVALISLGSNYDSKNIRFYDRRFDYDTYIKNLTVITYAEEYEVVGVVEESADFISYQTTKPEGGRFDMRVIAGLDGLDYKNFGYDVYLVNKDANGDPVVREYSEVGCTVFSSIYGGDVEYSIKDNFGYEYACLMTLQNLDVTSSYTELVIRPFAMGKDGNKKYGKATILLYVGEGESGYPEFRVAGDQESSLPYELNLAKIKNKGYEPWGYAQKLVDEWFTTDRAKAYANTYDAFNVGNMRGTTKISINSKNGAHTVAMKGSSSSPNPNFKTLYARTIESLAQKGYTPATGDEVSEYDVYGGITNSGLTGATATGFFHVETLSDGRMYLIDPLGNPFFVTAFNSINAGTTAAQKAYVTDTLGLTEDEYWADMTASLRAIGVNAATGSFDQITAQGDNSLCGIVGIKGISGYMGSLSLGTSTGGQSSFKYNDTMNVFDPDFITYTDKQNKIILEKYKDNPYIIGYTSDNELPRRTDMLGAYLTLDPSVLYNAFSYATAWTWFIEKTGKILPSLSDITPELSEEFKAFVFSALFKTVSDQVERYDGNHMYIGTRANGTNRNSEGYLRAAGAYCGMLTINMYDGLEPSGDIIEAIYKYSGKPFIVTEFYSKAQDAYGLNGDLLANQSNAGFLVQTQEDRATYYQNYTLLLLESKYCVGWIWYRFQDNDQSLYKIVTADGQTFENLRAWVKGDRYDIKSFIREGFVDGGTKSANLITLDVAKAVNSKGDSAEVSISYTNASGATVKTTGTLTCTYKGESDTSNLGSNKGIVDNEMNIYEPLADAITLIGDNIFSLIDYFDNTVNAGK